MATNRVKGITIEIGGDTTGLDKALSGVNKEIGTTKKELKDVERLLKIDPGNTELLRQKQEALKNEVSQTTEKLQTLKSAQSEVEQAYANGDIDKGAYDAFKREIIDTENQLKSLKTQLSEANVAAQKLAQAGEGMKNFGANVENVGKKLMPISTAVAGLGVAAVKTTADFDAQMSKVAALSGAEGKNFDDLRAKARAMGASTKFSATEAAEAMEYMALAGWDTEQMLGGIEGIMNLAAASGEDLATTSDIVTDALTAFGLGAGDAEKFADLLAKTSASANTNVAMMGETFKYAAPVMGAMGYSAEDTALAVGLMANAGIKASSAGTSLRGLMSRMAKPTDEVSMAMDRLGISLYNEEGKMYSFYEIMEQMRAGFGNINMPVEEFNTRIQELEHDLEDGTVTQSQYEKSFDELISQAYGAEEAEKARAAAMLAGKNAMSGMLAIVNASDEDFYKLKEAIDTSGGSAESMAQIMQDNLSGQLTILMSQLQELAISFGDMLMPYLKDAVTWLQGIMDKLNGMDEDTRKTIIQVGLFVAALGPLLIILGKVATGIGSILTLAPKIVAGIETMKTAFSALWAIIMANPIVAITAAIVGLVALIATKGDEIQGLLNKLDTFLQNIFAKDFTKVFGTVLGGAINTFMQSVKGMWDNVKLILDGMINFIRGVFTGNWQRAWEGVKQIFAGVFNGLKSLALAPINNIIGLINGLFTGINGISSSISKVTGKSFPQIKAIPYLAKGGTFSDGSAIVGEAGAELLTLQNGAATVQPLTSGGNTGHTDITDLLRQYLPYLANDTQIVLDSGVLVGATAPAMNNALGKIAMRSGTR